MCFTAASSRTQPSRVMRAPRRTNGKRAFVRSERNPESRQKARPERYTGMVWIWAEEEVKPRFWRTVGWKAVSAEAAMLQAKQANNLCSF